jgi:hypothetical protein
MDPEHRPELFGLVESGSWVNLGTFRLEVVKSVVFGDFCPSFNDTVVYFFRIRDK